MGRSSVAEFAKIQMGRPCALARPNFGKFGYQADHIPPVALNRLADRTSEGAQVSVPNA